MWITVATPSLSSLEQVDAVIAQIDSPPEGMHARYVGTTDKGELRVISLWESKEQAQRFMAEKLGPAFARVLGPEVQGNADITFVEVARTYEAEPVG
ncbi:MAG TPA: hypothetical protein VFJ85_06355 [Acidimicrobiales bacterium]|nr:hypothetical protein [Acidimicrobiales bacterium]